ncbi:hypothetical protein D3C85_726430 [compost metagenome]
MKFAKYLFIAIIAAIRKEMTIQKPTPEMVAMHKCSCNCQQETRQERIRKTGFSGIAMFLLICIGAAVLVL